MRIVVDENIPFGTEAFSRAGDVVRLAGRAIRPEHLADASALIVRSVTKVDASLLEGSPVRFVGTCTIGTDHLDIPWLESRGIAWCSAPGCNARSVAEYVVAAICWAHRRRVLDPARRPRVGVVGVGRVGRAVADLLESLGLEVLRNDPPRAEAEGGDGFVGLEELLERCAVVCAHLPLTRSGPHPTAGLLDWNRLRLLPRGALFLNAGRGPTSPTEGLRRILTERSDVSLVLDVWDPEPAVPPDLLRGIGLGTPHVAGYSFEGKVEGTRMVQERLASLWGLPAWEIPVLEPDPVDLPQAVAIGTEPGDALSELVLAACGIEDDFRRMREIAMLPERERGEAFDRLRREYPVRREFRNRPVRGWERLPPLARESAERIGFRPA